MYFTRKHKTEKGQGSGLPRGSARAYWECAPGPAPFAGSVQTSLCVICPCSVLLFCPSIILVLDLHLTFCSQVNPRSVDWTVAPDFSALDPRRPLNYRLNPSLDFSASPTHEILIPRSLFRFFQPSLHPLQIQLDHLTSNLVTKHAHCYGNTDAEVLQSNDLPWEIVLREENTSLPTKRSLSRLRGLPVASAPYLHLPQSPQALWDVFAPAHRNSERIPYNFQTLWCGFESIENVRP